MRLKSFIFFVILLAGVAFSQQGKSSDRISLENIIEMLSENDYDRMLPYTWSEGYSQPKAGNFKKGDHEFSIVHLAKQNLFMYQELTTQEFRVYEIKEQALKYGMKIVKERGKQNVVLEGKGFVVDAKVGSLLKIFQKK